MLFTRNQFKYKDICVLSEKEWKRHTIHTYTNWNDNINIRQIRLENKEYSRCTAVVFIVIKGVNLYLFFLQFKITKFIFSKIKVQVDSNI